MPVDLKDSRRHRTDKRPLDRPKFARRGGDGGIDHSDYYLMSSTGRYETSAGEQATVDLGMRMRATDISHMLIAVTSTALAASKA